MSKTFHYLSSELYPFLQKEDTRFRQATSLRKCAAVTLWRLVTKSYRRNIGHLFGISKASVWLQTSFAKLLQRTYIEIPVGPELERLVTELKFKWGFSHIDGANNGFHIPIKALVEIHANYYNCKGLYSSKRFWWRVYLLRRSSCIWFHCKLEPNTSSKKK